MNHEETQVCAFRVGTVLYGIEVSAIREVLREQPVTPVPLSAAAVRGLMNLRGQIVTVLDLRIRMGLAAPGDGAREDGSVHLILRTSGHPVSLAVDEVEDVLTVRYDEVEEPPVTLPESGRGLITGAYRLAERLLLLLDEERVLELD